ncbi:peptide-methionine (R)-S-oxide reductase MsrB [Nonlabens sp. Asnod3-H03]|uniref:peptide-methionine (R)-S-oxide reductase n=1 Tax=Nonlabens ulvanivorans TaxID=906888 RepID=A0A081DAW4_NONUL|nr:peptide-methionine (R)-S-oxide reductase MsrB [Nonlabens ulvanivorans]GAK76060.1 peptide methmonine sulfoxide reductase MsrB [Nonlabens ulvanivorans]
MKYLIIALTIIAAIGCKTSTTDLAQNDTQEKVYEVQKSDAQWKAELTPAQYDVLRRAGTERPHTSPLNKQYAAGTLICAACNAPVYDNANKFDSGTGWPSYDQAIEGQVERDVDYKIGYARTELKCNTCGSHLGHEFNDGPSDTTGKRHCINGVALEFIPEGEAIPALNK